ncbi:MAG: pyrroline-5-carboxylate reductase [candidate division Zixibacteria bacterium]|nr:pyrroline-5-carboxylate reductase [candidate division Zixibacteria bacterium]
MIRDKKLLILGVGNMGSALLGGIRKADLAPAEAITVTDQRPEHLADLAGRWGVHSTRDNAEAVPGKDIIILCVKPQTIGRVLTDIAPHLSPHQLIISIAAGVPTSFINTCIAQHNPVIRVMPNIAALVDEGAAAICLGQYATDQHKNMAQQIFEAVGRVVLVREELMDAVTGLSGSGPAYIYMVIEALSDGGVKMGLPRDISLSLAAQTVLGAARLYQETGVHPAVLRDQVMTPGGTTIAAVHELETKGLRSMLISAVETATKRSMELSRAGNAPA